MPTSESGPTTGDGVDGNGTGNGGGETPRAEVDAGAVVGNGGSETPRVEVDAGTVIGTDAKSTGSVREAEVTRTREEGPEECTETRSTGEVGVEDGPQLDGSAGSLCCASAGEDSTPTESVTDLKKPGEPGPPA